MNTIIISGKIIDIDYRLVERGKIFGIAFSKIKIENGSEVKVIFKNNLADTMLRFYNVKDKILVEGYLSQNQNGVLVIAEKVKKWNFNKYIEGFGENGKVDKK